MYKVVRQSFLDSSEKAFEGQTRGFQLYYGNKGIISRRTACLKLCRHRGTYCVFLTKVIWNDWGIKCNRRRGLKK